MENLFTGDRDNNVDLFVFWERVRRRYTVRFERAVKDVKYGYSGLLNYTDLLQDVDTIAEIYSDVLTGCTRLISSCYRESAPANYLYGVIEMAEEHLFQVRNILDEHLERLPAEDIADIANFVPTYDIVRYREHLRQVLITLRRERQSKIDECSEFLDQFHGSRIRI